MCEQCGWRHRPDAPAGATERASEGVRALLTELGAPPERIETEMARLAPAGATVMHTEWGARAETGFMAGSVHPEPSEDAARAWVKFMNDGPTAQRTLVRREVTEWETVTDTQAEGAHLRALPRERYDAVLDSGPSEGGAR